MHHARFLIPSVENRACGFHRTRLNTFDCSPWGDHEASVPISPVPRVSTRGQLARSLGTFVSLFSKARGLRPQSSSWCTWLSHVQTTTPHPPPPRDLGIASGVSPCLLSTCLGIPREVSRVQHRRLKRNETGGVFLSWPLPLSAAPQSLHRGEGRVTSVTLALPSERAGLGPSSHRSSMIAGSTG